LKFVNANTNHPFFLYLAFNAPHGASNLEKESFQAPDKFIALYPPAKDEKGENRRKYMACVTCMDAAIGELLDQLNQLNLERNTLVLFLSDNGGAGISDNKPLRGRKGDTWEGGIRVPFIARWPARIPAGTVTGEFITSLEIVPTLISAAHASRPKGVILDGFDMLPVLSGKTKSSRTEMFWERRQYKAARVENFKWVDMESRTGLFDLSTDISEQHDLSNEKPEVLQRIKSRFTAWKDEMEKAEPRGPFRNY
jgi:arylsulfatase A-like enzyme